MAKAAKLLEKARNQPGGLSFDDFEALLSRLGWVKRGQEGSHRLWYSPKGYSTLPSSRLRMARQSDIRSSSSLMRSRGSR